MVDFRQWLEEGMASGQLGDNAAPAEPPDLHTLLGQMIGLRQEVNLQTRAVRQQQELNGQTLDQLERTVQALERRQAAGRDALARQEEDLLRPVLKTLVDLYDALALARDEVQRLRQVLDQQEELLARQAHLEPPPPALPRGKRPPLWLRLLNRIYPDPRYQTIKRELEALQNYLAHGRDQIELARAQNQFLDSFRHGLDALLTGYALGLERLDRALAHHQLEPMVVQGEPFDPETMEVVEAVAEAGRSATVVLEEVRRGYFWRGRVFRYAQVRVAKPG